MELIKQEIEKQTGQAIKVDIDHLSFPRFRQMFDDQREFRDQYIVQKIADVSQKYDRVMVVMGSGHAIRDREALEQYFDINNKVLDSRIDNTDLKDTISPSIQSEAEKSTPRDGINEQNPPPPDSDPDVIKKYNEAEIQAQLQYEREQAERDRQGIEAARQRINNIPGATMEVVKEYHAPAGKEVIKVNTYTPKSEPSTVENGGQHTDSLTENSQLREDRLVDENEGYQLVSSHIKNGEIVLMGDMHSKKKTHELFLNYMDKLSSDGLPFSLALELPSQLTEKIIDKSPEEIIEMTSEIYRNKKEVFSNFFAEDILSILKLAKDRNIKILCIDEEQSGIKDKNEMMASQLKKARQSGVQAILTMVGQHHAQAIAIPKYIDAFSVHMGEDKAFLGKKSFDPGMFDTQIKIAGDNSIFS